jgi:oligosaccharide repeat unit polymerase
MKNNLGKNGIILIFLCILISAAYFYLGSSKFDLYIFSLVILLSLNIILILANPIKLTDANIIFLGIYLIKYSSTPLIYAYKLSWAVKCTTLHYNWDLLAKGNFGAILGLIGYGVGYWVSNRHRPSRRPFRELLTEKRCRLLFKIYLGLAILGWSLIFMRAGFPQEVLYWIPPDRRAYTGQGWSHIYTILFGAIIAQLCFMIYRRNTSPWSIPNLLIMLLASWLLAIEGQRLTILTLAVGAIFLRNLIKTQKTPAGEPVRRQRVFSLKKIIALASLAVVIFGFSFWYGLYRHGAAKTADFANALALNYQSASLFDTSISYYLAIDEFPSRFPFWHGMSFLSPVLINIPKFIFENKYNYIYNGNRFQGMVYGIDANDPGNTVYGYDILAEIYTNFGWFGIPLILFIVAIINNRMSLKAHSPSCSMFFKVIYICYIFLFIVYGTKAGLSTGILSMLNKVFLFFIVPVWLVSRMENVPIRREIRVLNRGLAVSREKL